MIKIQKEDFNVEEEISLIKKIYSNIGAVTSFVGYVRDNNNNTNVESIYSSLFFVNSLIQAKYLIFIKSALNLI